VTDVSKRKRAPAVATQDIPDRTKLNTANPIELSPASQAESRPSAAVFEALCWSSREEIGALLSEIAARAETGCIYVGLGDERVFDIRRTTLSAWQFVWVMKRSSFAACDPRLVRPKRPAVCPPARGGTMSAIDLLKTPQAKKRGGRAPATRFALRTRHRSAASRRGLAAERVPLSGSAAGLTSAT